MEISGPVEPSSLLLGKMSLNKKIMSFWYQNAPWDVGGKDLPKWVSFLTDLQCMQANLTHHLPGSTELELLATLPSALSWAIHLSSKTLGSTSLNKFLDKARALPTVHELLVVSGNPKPKRTSLDLLDELSQLNLPFGLAVAASPLDNYETLTTKLSHPAVKRLYLQLAEPKYWDPLIAHIRTLRSDIQISASWLPVTPANWSALSMFPWKGSVLSQDWKNSINYAEACAQDQLDWMREHNVTPLIEPRRITKDLLETVRKYNF